MKKTFTDISELKKALQPVSNVAGSKELKFAGFKTSSSKPTDDQLKLINRFTRTPFTADDMYVGQLRLANNCIDRDNERFSEEVLQRYAATAIRKTMLFDHGRNVQAGAVGKFFDVMIEKMPLQQANAETGENFQLPANVTEVWFLTVSFYIPVKGVDEQTLVKIDAGVYDFASIGFRCESMVPVMDKDGKILFWEYRGTGPRTEMTEGSLVYLGAQHGMSVKGLDSLNGLNGSSGLNGSEETPQGDITTRPEWKGKSHEGGKIMEITKLLAMLMRLFPGKTFTTEDAVESEVRAAIEASNRKSVEDAAVPLNIKIAELEPLKGKVAELEPFKAKVADLETKVAQLTPQAADGKTFRDSMVDAYVKAKANLKEITDKPEDQAKIKTMAQGFDIEFLKTEVEHLQKRVAAAFPAGSEVGGSGDPEEKKRLAEEEDPLKPKTK
jgi:hypothetical protein